MKALVHFKGKDREVVEIKDVEDGHPNFEQSPHQVGVLILLKCLNGRRVYFHPDTILYIDMEKE